MRTQKIIGMLIILMSISVIIFAQEADIADVDIRSSILLSTNYHIDFADIARLQNTSLADGFAWNNWQFAIAFQMLFGLNSDVALGFEVGFSTSPPAGITFAFPAEDSLTNSIITAQYLLPRFVVELFHREQISLTFLTGLRFAVDYTARDGRFSINPLFSEGALETFRFSMDLEVRANFALSDAFAFYIGLNYILPFEVFAGDQNRFTPFDQNNPAVGFPGVLTPSLGMRISF